MILSFLTLPNNINFLKIDKFYFIIILILPLKKLTIYLNYEVIKFVKKKLIMIILII